MESYSTSRMSSWVSFMMLALCFSFNGVAYARHPKQLHSAATIVGTVYCDTCFRQQAPKSTHFISGATVAVECGNDGKHQFRQETKTNDNGEFEANLPPSIGKSLEKIKGCSVKLISSGKPYCSVAATATSSEIRFKSKKAGAHIFSAGFFTFKPELCNQKDFTKKDFPPSLPDPPAPFLPPIGEGILPPVALPDLPVPPLVPPLPRIPGVPVPLLPPETITRQKLSKSDELFDKKTFGFPPNLFQPSPPSSLNIPPILPSPLTGLLFPPLPGLISSPPQPAVGIPGIPPGTPASGSPPKTSP